MPDDPLVIAATYIRDGHDLTATAAKFGVSPDTLRTYVSEKDARDSVRSDSTPVTSEKDTRDREDTPPSVLLGSVRDGAWLDQQRFPPLRYAVPGLIPEGFTVLAGAPKVGKSWLILALLLAVASGGAALGKIHTATPRRVLYLALEDGHRRMQSRCRALLRSPYRPADPIPARFHYLTRVTPDTVLQTIEEFLDAHPDTALVVIDTLGKVMPPAFPNETTYGRDYRVGTRLKLVADERPGLAVVVLHHDRKAQADDFVEKVSGSNGLAGAADTIILLGRKRQSSDGLLSVTGREVPEAEYAITMSDDGTWTLDGSNLAAAADTARRRREQTSGMLSDLSSEILAYVRDHGGTATTADVRAKFGDNGARYLARLVDAGRLRRSGRGQYALPDVPPSQVSQVSLSLVRDPDETDNDADSVPTSVFSDDGGDGDER